MYIIELEVIDQKGKKTVLDLRRTRKAPQVSRNSDSEGSALFYLSKAKADDKGYRLTVHLGKKVEEGLSADLKPKAVAKKKKSK